MAISYARLAVLGSRLGVSAAQFSYAVIGVATGPAVVRRGGLQSLALDPGSIFVTQLAQVWLPAGRGRVIVRSWTFLVYSTAIAALCFLTLRYQRRAAMALGVSLPLVTVGGLLFSHRGLAPGVFAILNILTAAAALLPVWNERPGAA